MDVAAPKRLSEDSRQEPPRDVRPRVPRGLADQTQSSLSSCAQGVLVDTIAVATNIPIVQRDGDGKFLGVLIDVSPDAEISV